MLFDRQRFSWNLVSVLTLMPRSQRARYPSGADVTFSKVTLISIGYNPSILVK